MRLSELRRAAGSKYSTIKGLHSVLAKGVEELLKHKGLKEVKPGVWEGQLSAEYNWYVEVTTGPTSGSATGAIINIKVGLKNASGTLFI